MNMPMQPQQQKGVPFCSPVGRYVGGDLFEIAKGYGGRPAVTQAGEPKIEYVVKLAYPKMVNGQHNPEFWAFFAQLQQVAQFEFPHLGQIPLFYDPTCRFAWKVQDGDGVDGDGKPNKDKPGHAGCWIVSYKSKFKPKCYYVGRHNPNDAIIDPNVIPYGHYLRIGGNINGNKQQNKPGIYINIDNVEYVAGTPADVIVFAGAGRSAAESFGAAPVLPAGMQPIMPSAPAGLPPLNAPQAMPGMPPQMQPMPGAIAAPQMMPPAALPVMNGPASLGAAVPPAGFPPGGSPMGLPPGAAPAGVPVIPGYAAPTMQAPGLPAPGAIPGSTPLPGSAPPLAVQPHPGILAGPQPVQRVMLPAAGAYTYEQYIAAGYTDETLRAQRLMQ